MIAEHCQPGLTVNERRCVECPRRRGRPDRKAQSVSRHQMLKGMLPRHAPPRNGPRQLIGRTVSRGLAGRHAAATVSRRCVLASSRRFRAIPLWTPRPHPDPLHPWRRRGRSVSFVSKAACATREQYSMRLLMTDRPHIIRHRGEIGLGELGAAHRRHHTGVFLGLRYAADDRPGNRPDAAVAP